MSGATTPTQRKLHAALKGIVRLTVACWKPFHHSCCLPACLTGRCLWMDRAQSSSCRLGKCLLGVILMQNMSQRDETKLQNNKSMQRKEPKIRTALHALNPPLLILAYTRRVSLRVTPWDSNISFAFSYTAKDVPIDGPTLSKLGIRPVGREHREVSDLKRLPHGSAPTLVEPT
jgi:hypothetical protein